MNRKNRFILGLTGSIGMGKTTVSNMFRDIGVPVWCADQEVQNLYSDNGNATKIIKIKYPSVVGKKGVDKTSLRNLIHKDNRILEEVERIVHPLLKDSKDKFLQTNADANLLIFDIPLLFEKNQEKNYDGVLVVTASKSTQKRRVLSRSNMNEKDLQLIRRNQLDEDEKIKRADFIINTDKSLSDTRRDVSDLHFKINQKVFK